MYSVGGQSSHNFFKNAFTNQIGTTTSAATNTLGQKFATAESAQGWVGKVGLSDMASAGQDGKSVASPNFPFYLEFVPTSQVDNLFSDEYSEYFADQLATLKSGTVLWEVRAISEPGAASVKIGSLEMTSDMFKSKWGDEHLFFQHQAWPEDLTGVGSDWMSRVSEWGAHYINAAASAFQTKPVVASLFASPKWNAAYKAASAAADLASPFLPYTLVETEQAVQLPTRKHTTAASEQGCRICECSRKVDQYNL